MSFDNLLQDIDNLKKDILGAVDDAVEVASAGYTADLLRRVQFKGENSKSQKLGTYAKSTSTYKRNKGQETQFVNLTDTFEMLGSIGLTDKKTANNKVSFVIAPSDVSRGKITNKELMEIHEERYGEIMTATPEEFQDMVDTFQSAVDRVIARF